MCRNEENYHSVLRGHSYSRCEPQVSAAVEVVVVLAPWAEPCHLQDIKEYNFKNLERADKKWHAVFYLSVVD